MRSKIEAILDERVRPQLAQHLGDVALLDYEDGVVRIRLLGQCSNCPASYLTTEQLILAELREALPEVERVEAEHSVSAELLDQARAILGRHG